MTEVVVDNGQVYVSEETAIVATEAANRAKQWMQESERQANLAAGSATDAASSKQQAEAVITDADFIAVATDLQSSNSYIKRAPTNAQNAAASATQAQQSATQAQSAVQETKGAINKLFTNCITKIHKNVILEVDENNNLYVKAGSLVYVPAGFEDDETTPKFIEKEVTDDVYIGTVGSESDRLVIVKTNGEFGYQYRYLLENCYSGDTAPTVSTNSLWYDTANNIIKRTPNGESWIDTDEIALPLGIFHRTTTSIEIKQVFNGVGFIGYHVFILPGVEMCASNGFNDDQTIKAKKVVTEKVYIDGVGSESANRIAMFIAYPLKMATLRGGYEEVETRPENPTPYRLYYVRSENMAFSYYDGTWYRYYGVKVANIPTIEQNGYYRIDKDGFTQDKVTGISDETITKAIPSGVLGLKDYLKIGVLGGSFASKYYAETAFNLWRERLGLRYVTYAQGGTGFVQGEKNFVYQASHAGVRDIYVIWCSTNDFTHSIPIGTKNDVYGIDNTIWANFKEVIRILYSKNPNAKICLFTSSPHLTSSQGNEEGRGTVTTYTNTLKEHVDAQKEMCKFYSIPCLDQYNNSQQNGFNYSLVCISGGFHLTPYGYELLATNQIDFLSKL